MDRLRHDLAQRYITVSDLSLSEIAFNLGYANREMIRWVLQSPPGLLALAV